MKRDIVVASPKKEATEMLLVMLTTLENHRICDGITGGAFSVYAKRLGLWVRVGVWCTLRFQRRFEGMTVRCV